MRAGLGNDGAAPGKCGADAERLPVLLPGFTEGLADFFCLAFFAFNFRRRHHSFFSHCRTMLHALQRAVVFAEVLGDTMPAAAAAFLATSLANNRCSASVVDVFAPVSSVRLSIILIAITFNLDLSTRAAGASSSRRWAGPTAARRLLCRPC